MLELVDVHTYYGIAYVLQGISLKINDGSVVAMLGRNGMGKTTTIRTIAGLNHPRHGKVIFKGQDISNIQPHQIANMGMGYCPQGRQIFPSLTVKENLTTSARTRGRVGDWDLEKVYHYFPILKTRAKLRGTLLSGGEQQMLAVARALMTNPDMVLLDEPSEGLSPALVEDIGRIILELKQSGVTIFLVEQNYAMAMDVANYVYIISKGKIVHGCTPAELDANEEVKTKYLGVS
jgi:branched-chain amino acid transport system ATP-binding protein